MPPQTPRTLKEGGVVGSVIDGDEDDMAGMVFVGLGFWLRTAIPENLLEEEEKGFGEIHPARVVGIFDPDSANTSSST